MSGKEKRPLVALCRDFAENTSCHGCGNLVRSKGIFWRILWTLIILTAVVMLGRQIVQIVLRYRSNPINTQISVSTSPLPFPSVTMCNLNSMRLSALKETYSENVQKLRELMNRLKVGDAGAMESDAGTMESDAGTMESDAGHTMESDAGHIMESDAGYTLEDDGSTMNRRRKRKRQVSATSVPYVYDADAGYDNGEYQYNNYEWDEGDLDDDIDADDDLSQEFDAEYLIKQKIITYISRIPKNVSQAIGHTKNNFIHKCSFMGRECNMNRIPVCFRRQFADSWSTRYGNCYTFNPNEHRKSAIVVSRSGRGASLDLTFDLEHHEYLPMYTTGYGLVVVIHDFGTFPFPSQQGMVIPAGFHTSLALNMKNVTRLDKPYGDCVKGKWFQRLYNKKYTYEACATTCMHTKILERCGCYQQGATQYYDDKVNLTQPCDTDKEIQCMRQTRKEMRRELACTCKQPCQETVFESTLSMNQWPEQQYVKYLENAVCSTNRTETCERFQSLSAKDFRTTLASLTVYYRGLNYEAISQSPAYLLPNFLSDLGGTLGLWAGFSVLTCTEVLVLIFHFVKQTVSMCGEDKKEKKPLAEKDIEENVV